MVSDKRKINEDRLRMPERKKVADKKPLVQMSPLASLVAVLRTLDWYHGLDKNWKTMNHEHVLLNGKGKVVGGLGGKLNGKTWGTKWKFKKKAATNVSKNTQSAPTRAKVQANSASPKAPPAPKPAPTPAPKAPSPANSATNLTNNSAGGNIQPPSKPAAFVDEKAADSILRPVVSKAWKSATHSQKKAAFEYSKSYSQFQEPLRGYIYGTGYGSYVGPKKINWNRVGVGSMSKTPGQVKKYINDLTDLIDSNSLPQDMKLQRAAGFGGLEHFFKVPGSLLRSGNTTAIENAIKGKTVVEWAFFSTGAAKGKGLDVNTKPVLFEVDAPKGTKGLYIEPFGAYGNGAKSSGWDGNSNQTTIGDQQEVLLQRATTFVVGGVRKNHKNQLVIQLTVVGNTKVAIP